MSNRKATFAKRQREMDLKDKARAKQAAKVERQSQPKSGKGPQIDWSDPNYLATQAVQAGSDPTAPPPDPDAAADDADAAADSTDE